MGAEGGPTPPKKPHPLFLFFLLGFPALGIGVTLYVRGGLGEDEGSGSRCGLPPSALDAWVGLRVRSDQLSQAIHPANQRVFALEERIARGESVDIEPTAVALETLVQEARECDRACKTLLALLQEEFGLPDLAATVAKAKTMNTRDGLNIGAVIDGVALRIDDLATQQRKLVAMRKNAGSGSAEPDGNVPGTGS